MFDESTQIHPDATQANESSELIITADVADEGTNAVVADEGTVISQAGNSVTHSETPTVSRVRRWIDRVRHDFTSTYTKRHPIVNALLSLYLLLAAVLAFNMFIIGWNMVFSSFGGASLALYALALLFYVLYYIYYMYAFVVSNRRDAFYYTHMASVVVMFVVILLLMVLFTPDADDDYIDAGDDDSEFFTMVFSSLVGSLLLNAVLMGVVRMVMTFRKYGASAWTLLDVAHRRFRSKFDKVALYAFSAITLIVVLLTCYEYYKTTHPTERFASHATAQIGDYYYADGTVSSLLLPDKKAVGVVFALTNESTSSTSLHGQVVALSDISTSKMQWETGELKDYADYPNYTWDNRLDALSDVDGSHYTHCEGFITLSINYDCSTYHDADADGLSSWYVPTAGQWKAIIENLGGTPVDNLLRFDAETAARNLEKININPRHWYWTITEFDADHAWSIRIANGEFGSRTPKNNDAYVRPVANF